MRHRVKRESADSCGFRRGINKENAAGTDKAKPGQPGAENMVQELFHAHNDWSGPSSNRAETPVCMNT